MPALQALERYQFGVETVHGTLVAATHGIICEHIDFDETGLMFRPALAKGLLLRNRGNETPTQRGTLITLPDTPLNYEQLQAWLSMSVVGGVTGVGVAPTVWTYTRSLTADPTPQSWTFERRLNDIAAQVDHEWGYVMASQIGFKYVEGEPLRFNAQLFGRRQQASTFTPALSIPTPEIAPSALMKAYLDTSWGALGGTQLTAQIIGAELIFNTGLMPQMTADGRTDLDFTTYILNPDEVWTTLKLTCLLDTTRFATEKAAAVAGTLRAIRLQVSGSSSRDLKLDGLYKYTKPDILLVGSENGQNTVVLELESATDGTNLFSAVLSNNTAVLGGA
jgi:hypothetical protein